VASISLEMANKGIAAALRMAREKKMHAMTICVLDTGGHLVSAQREDNSGNFRFEIAFGKAWGALGMGHSTRWIQEDLGPRFPLFVNSLSVASQGRLIPMLGGVLIRSKSGELMGAVGVTGDLAANDEAVAVAAIEACGLTADLK
jgi:uncharacterized protein GlcG (DUF336 family)